MPDDPFRLDGKTALVVGAALGIGHAFALALAEAGAKVACLDIDEAGAGDGHVAACWRLEPAWTANRSSASTA